MSVYLLLVAVPWVQLVFLVNASWKYSFSDITSDSLLEPTYVVTVTVELQSRLARVPANLSRSQTLLVVLLRQGTPSNI